jgi:hypothetical protein
MFVNGSGRNEQSLQRTFHRCFQPRFGSFSPVVSEEKIFKYWTIRNKNYLWWPCLLMDWYEISNFYRRPSIDASYQVSDHLAEGFQRRRFKCEKLTDDRRWTPSDGKSSFSLWRGELKSHHRSHASDFMFVCFMVLKATFNNISVILWRSVLIYWWRKPEYREICRKSLTNFIT